MIEVALAEVGTTEWPRNSNRVKYNTEYYGCEVSGLNYPWCVVFLWWVFRHADEAMAFFNSGKTASCTILSSLYKAEGRWVTSDYRIGDLVMLNFDGKKTTDHVGLVIDVCPNYLVTIEGNTSPGLEGSQNNGGSVARKIRYFSNIVGACRPNYKEEEIMPETDYESHWAKEDIDAMKKLGLMQGYPDGSFKPDQPLSRAEAASILNRFYELMTAKTEG